MQPHWTPQDVSAVVCTLNSMSSIERCLTSLRAESVGEIIVVDAHSQDGTREIAEALADSIVEDLGLGLGNARNLGIAHSTKPLVLNMGSDNVMLEGQLQRMISFLEESRSHGVSAQTIIEGSGFLSRGLNAWRKGRFRPGPSEVIGTPTLFVGDVLRSHPYDATRVFSDDSELCERWSREFNATFAISDAYVGEVGKTSLKEIIIRCRMYGISDEEVFRTGSADGWSLGRKGRSLLHPLRADFIEPVTHLPWREAVRAAPFLLGFSALRYVTWAIQAAKAQVVPRDS